MTNGTDTPKSGSEWLNALQLAETTVSIALPVVGQAIPLVVGVIKGIRALKNDATGTVDYVVEVGVVQAQLDAIVTGATSDIDDINAELAKIGLPPLAAPTA